MKIDMLQRNSKTKNMLRLALVGKTGVGKSNTGNTILNGNTADPPAFLSSCQGTSVTETCQVRDNIVLGRKIQVIDTPGLLDNRKECQKEVLTEITRCIYMSAPGPHAILHVVEIGRFTPEDVLTINEFVKHFGKALFKHIVIVFTMYDRMKRDLKQDLPNIMGHVKTMPNDVKNFIMDKCNGRVVAFDNTLVGSAADAQIRELFSVIDNLLHENNDSYYTNEDYKKAEEVLKEEMEKEKKRLEKERDEELKKRQEEIDRAADEKAKHQIRIGRDQYIEMMESRISRDNLREHAQNSPNGFEMFQVMASVFQSVVSVLKLF